MKTLLSSYLLFQISWTQISLQYGDVSYSWKIWEILTAQYEYKNLEYFLGQIDEPNRAAAKNLLETYKDIINTAKWSQVKHQAWEWWYRDHLQEICNIAWEMYCTFNKRRKLPFSFSDVILVLFLHDLEKPFKYAWSEEQKEQLKSYWKNYQQFIVDTASQFWFTLSEDHLNALKYIHWEGDEHNPTERIQKPLAAFVHDCDTWSARWWPEHPQRHGETWGSRSVKK